MRTIEDVRRVQALIKDGINNCEIARRTGIPRETIRDWRHGKLPRRGPRGPNGNRALPENSCPACGHPLHDFGTLPASDYAYLLGLYLGDGCISAHRRGVFRLRILLDRRYPGIVHECVQAVAAVMPSSRVGVLPRHHEKADEVGSYSRAWPCLFPQHGPGRKHLRKIELVSWQLDIVRSHPQKLLRGLIHSDGSYSVNTIKHPKKTYVYPRYLFSNRSGDIRRLFCDVCDRIGIEWRVMTKYDISIAHRESIALMDEFVGPKE
jgi:hypothetical protein